MDNIDSTDCKAVIDFSSPQSSGTIEYYVFIEGTDSKRKIDTRFGWEDLVDDKTCFRLIYHRDTIQIEYGTGPFLGNERTKTLVSGISGKWIHIRLIVMYRMVRVIIDHVDKGHYFFKTRNYRLEKMACQSWCKSCKSPSRVLFDAFGFSWDPNYVVGDNLAKQAIRDEISTTAPIFDQNLLEMLDAVKIEYDDKGNIIDHGLRTKYPLFKTFIKIAQYYDPKRWPIFYNTMGGKLCLRWMDFPKMPPKLFFIETYKLTSFPGDYGPGRIIKTFSLLPGEETEISIKTWKKSTTSTKEASSILDSYTEEKADEFEKNIQQESTQTSKLE